MSELRPFATALVRRWTEIESALLSAADFPSFPRFLDSYRGLPRDPPPPEEQSEAQAAVGDVR